MNQDFYRSQSMYKQEELQRAYREANQTGQKKASPNHFLFFSKLIQNKKENRVEIKHSCCAEGC